MTVDEPPLQWTFNMVQEPLITVVNAINTALPLFAVGEAHVEVPDQEEYEQLRSAAEAGVG